MEEEERVSVGLLIFLLLFLSLLFFLFLFFYLSIYLSSHTLSLCLYVPLVYLHFSLLYGLEEINYKQLQLFYFLYTTCEPCL